MEYRKILIEKKSAILERWRKLLLDTYSPDAASFYGSVKDRFANPVGSVFSDATQKLFDLLLNESDPERICACLEEMIKIRAVQDFSPSRAVGFVILLKQAVLDVLNEQNKEVDVLHQFIKFGALIDQVSLFAFDIYVSCRERVYQLRVNEVKRRVSRVLNWTESTDPGGDPDPKRDCLESQ